MDAYLINEAGTPMSVIQIGVRQAMDMETNLSKPILEITVHALAFDKSHCGNPLEFGDIRIEPMGMTVKGFVIPIKIPDGCQVVIK